MPLDPDINELIFRVLFSSIFLGLGGEHIVSDHLIRRLMPAWVPAPRLFSVLAGVVLLIGGTMVLLGWQLRAASWILGVFLVVVTAAVHLPAVVAAPPPMPEDSKWMWIVLQRSNLVKNLCLLGVCFLLYNHVPGPYSLAAAPLTADAVP
jgi:uncharacterized membrane protein YphA (DoxX/SURF4 family)